MDNEGVYEAQVDDEARLIEDLSPRRRAGREHRAGPSSSKSYGATKDNDLETEETPLLSRTSSEVVNAGAAPPSYDEAITQPWIGSKELQGKTWYKRPSIYWLLPPFLPFTLAFGGVMVPRINLILNLICRDYLADRAALDTSFQFHPVIFGADNPQCQIPEVQALVARFQLYSNLIAGILSAIVSPKMGVLSDRYGRKRIIAIATLGTLLGEAITVLIASYPDDFSVNWILLGSFFDGLCGSFTTAMALIHAYNADCTPPERRNVTFAYFHATLFTGIAAGPILAGYLVNWTGHIITVFYVAIGCHLFFLIFLFFIIPESVSKERQMIAREKWRTKMLDPEERTWILTARNYNVLAMTKSFFQPLGILRPTGPGSSRDLRRNLFFLAAIDTAMFGVAMGTMNVIVIYSEYMFGWGNLESSIFVSIVNTCRVCGLLLILPTVTRIVRGPMSSRRQQRNSGSDLLDINIIRIAILFDLTGYIGYSTVRKGYLLIISGAIASLGGMGSPTLQSALTKHVPPDRTGQLLGATGLLHALARVIAPTIFNLIYSVTVGKFTQTVFVCLASVFGVASVFSWFIKPHVYLDDPVAPNPNPNPRPRSSGLEEVGEGGAGGADDTIR